jgi:hypothetical protein
MNSGGRARAEGVSRLNCCRNLRQIRAKRRPAEISAIAGELTDHESVWMESGRVENTDLFGQCDAILGREVGFRSDFVLGDQYLEDPGLFRVFKAVRRYDHPRPPFELLATAGFGAGNFRLRTAASLMPVSRLSRCGPVVYHVPI